MKHLLVAFLGGACCGALLASAAQTRSVPGLSAAMAQTTTTLAPLPRLDLTGMQLWNYDQTWHASQWSNAFSTIPWVANRIVTQPDGKVAFFLDSAGGPQLQGANRTVAHTSGLWEVDVTLPVLRDGLIVAPLWLYNSQTRDEIDFEFVGRKGLDVTMHAYPNGQHVKTSARIFAGQDLSQKRLRLGIKLNVASGKAEMLVNGSRVHTFDRQQTRFFVTSGLKPWMEMWAANPANVDLVNWTGKWLPLPFGTRLQMTIHGYRYTP